MFSFIFILLGLGLNLSPSSQNPGPALNGRSFTLGVPCSSLPFVDTFPQANGPLSASWLVSSGSTFTVVSHNLTTPAFDPGGSVAWTNCPGWTSSHYSQYTVTASGSSSNFGLTLNNIDENNLYYVVCGTVSPCEASTKIGGTYSFVGSFSSAVSVGQTVCAELDSGTTVKLKINGVYDGLTYTVGGLTTGSSGGGVIYGAQDGTPAAVNNFQTGNGLCP